MSKARFAAVVAGALLTAALYFLPIPQRGLVGPDEPRYASIARHMAESGDWVTPTLWGEPWFEKPALLFWLGGMGVRAGLEAFTRIPVALLCLAFLAYLHWRLRERFDAAVATAAACILGTSAGWVAFSDAGVFDAPLTVFTGAALLALLPWVEDPDAAPARRGVAAFGAFLGLAVLSKGLVGPVVAALAVAPAVLARPRRALDLLGPRALGPFAAVCLPWYLLCYLRNGRIFVDEFLVRHHWERFVSPSLQHEQPAWFFLPVLLAFALPWTPLLFGLRRADLWGSPLLRFLSAWAFLPVAFFSASVNKLPAYILPCLPPLAILLAIQWHRRPKRGYLVGGALTLLLVPLAGALLPEALADGVTRAWAGLEPADLVASVAWGAAAAGIAGVAALKAGRKWAVPGVAAVAALALALLKLETYPAASDLAGTREFVEGNRGRIASACLGDVRRHAAYGIRHYSRDGVPPCAESPRPLRIEGDPPRVAEGP